jgi:hypothetical protein
MLLTTLLWGGCISCEQYFMWAGTKSCCGSDGHCKRKTPAEKKSGAECRQIAFDHQKTPDLHIDLPVIAVARFEIPLPTVKTIAPRRDLSPVEPSPPDLQILHSTFLI